MTQSPLLVPLGVLLLLLVGAVLGPVVVRGATPALVRAPRLALGLLLGAALAWVVTLLSLGPLLAWLNTGPAWLPSGAAEVCERCLAAASPFAQDAHDTGLPTVLLLLGPLLMLLILVARLGHRWRRRAQQGRALAHEVARAGRPHQVGRTTVQLIDSAQLMDAAQPLAFALPGRPAHIVLSSATVQALNRKELLAVVEHERAHLTQRHHTVRFLVSELAALLPFVPLLRAIADAVPHYLEIAADATAVRRVGTSALAGALLHLGDPQTPAWGAPPHAGSTPPHDPTRSAAAYRTLALHVAGPGRVQHLLAPAPVRHGLTAATGFALGLSASLGTVLFIIGSYLTAVATGCV